MNARFLRGAGIAAALLHVAAVAGFGWALEGYSLGRHPAALLGASGVPHALAFNLLAFVMPGALALWAMLGLVRCVPPKAGWPLRLGAQMQLIAALAFIAMGLLPLDAQDVDNAASGLHASMWMLWALAFMLGALLLARGGMAQPAWRRVGMLGWPVGLLVFILGFVLGGPFAQRMVFWAWALWLALLPRLLPVVRGP